MNKEHRVAGALFYASVLAGARSAIINLSERA